MPEKTWLRLLISHPQPAQQSGFHPALQKAAALWAFASVVCALLGRAPAQRPIPLGRGELHWETSLAQAGGRMMCHLEKGSRHHCERLWLLGASPRSDLWRWPRSDPRAAGRSGLDVSPFPRLFLHPVSLFSPQRFRPLIYAKAWSRSRRVCLPFPSGKQGWGALPSPPSSDLTHHMAWSKIVVLFFIVNLSVPQYPIRDKKRGWTQFWKAVWKLCMQHGAPLPWVSLHIWLLMLLFPFSSYTRTVEVMLEALLGTRTLFSFRKNPTKTQMRRQHPFLRQLRLRPAAVLGTGAPRR